MYISGVCTFIPFVPGASAGAGSVTLDDIFSTRSVYGVGLGHIYNPAD